MNAEVSTNSLNKEGSRRAGGRQRGDPTSQEPDARDSKSTARARPNGISRALSFNLFSYQRPLSVAQDVALAVNLSVHCGESLASVGLSVRQGHGSKKTSDCAPRTVAGKRTWPTLSPAPVGGRRSRTWPPFHGTIKSSAEPRNPVDPCARTPGTPKLAPASISCLAASSKPTRKLRSHSKLRKSSEDSAT